MAREKDPQELVLKQYEWYHGPISRHDAIGQLEHDGDFLVRDCISTPGDYVLTCMWGGKALHFRLNKVRDPDDPAGSNLYQFEDDCFPSVADLIVHHLSTGQPVSNASGAVIAKPKLSLAAASNQQVIYAKLTPPAVKTKADLRCQSSLSGDTSTATVSSNGSSNNMECKEVNAAAGANSNLAKSGSRASLLKDGGGNPGGELKRFKSLPGGSRRKVKRRAPSPPKQPKVTSENSSANNIDKEVEPLLPQSNDEANHHPHQKSAPDFADEKHTFLQGVKLRRKKFKHLLQSPLSLRQRQSMHYSTRLQEYLFNSNNRDRDDARRHSMPRLLDDLEDDDGEVGQGGGDQPSQDCGGLGLGLNGRSGRNFLHHSNLVRSPSDTSIMYLSQLGVVPIPSSTHAKANGCGANEIDGRNNITSSAKSINNSRPCTADLDAKPQANLTANHNNLSTVTATADDEPRLPAKTRTRQNLEGGASSRCSRKNGVGGRHVQAALGSAPMGDSRCSSVVSNCSSSNASSYQSLAASEAIYDCLPKPRSCLTDDQIKFNEIYDVPRKLLASQPKVPPKNHHHQQQQQHHGRLLGRGDFDPSSGPASHDSWFAQATSSRSASACQNSQQAKQYRPPSECHSVKSFCVSNAAASNKLKESMQNIYYQQQSQLARHRNFDDLHKSHTEAPLEPPQLPPKSRSSTRCTKDTSSTLTLTESYYADPRSLGHPRGQGCTKNNDGDCISLCSNFSYCSDCNPVTNDEVDALSSVSGKLTTTASGSLASGLENPDFLTPFRISPTSILSMDDTLSINDETSLSYLEMRRELSQRRSLRHPNDEAAAAASTLSSVSSITLQGDDLSLTFDTTSLPEDPFPQGLPTASSASSTIGSPPSSRSSSSDRYSKEFGECCSSSAAATATASTAKEAIDIEEEEERVRVADQHERGGRDDGEDAEVSHPAEADSVTDQPKEEDMEPDKPHQQLSVEEEAIVLQQPDKEPTGEDAVQSIVAGIPEITGYRVVASPNDGGGSRPTSSSTTSLTTPTTATRLETCNNTMEKETSLYTLGLLPYERESPAASSIPPPPSSSAEVVVEAATVEVHQPQAVEIVGILQGSDTTASPATAVLPGVEDTVVVDKNNAEEEKKKEVNNVETCDSEITPVTGEIMKFPPEEGKRDNKESIYDKHNEVDIFNHRSSSRAKSRNEDLRSQSQPPGQIEPIWTPAASGMPMVRHSLSPSVLEAAMELVTSATSAASSGGTKSTSPRGSSSTPSSSAANPNPNPNPSYNACSIFQPASFTTPFLSEPSSRALDPMAISNVLRALIETPAPLLAVHMTQLDLGLFGLRKASGEDNNEEIHNYQPRGSLKLLHQVQGSRFRQDVMERFHSLRTFVEVSILAATNLGESAAVMAKWIRVAEESRLRLGNHLGFYTIGSVLVCSSHLQKWQQLWLRLDKAHGQELKTLNGQVRPAMQAVSELDVPWPPNITLPNVVPYLLACPDVINNANGERIKSASKARKELYALCELCCGEAKADFFGKYRETFPTVNDEWIETLEKNAQLVYRNVTNFDDVLLDLFRTEFHIKLLWGTNGSVDYPLNSEERHAKFAKVLSTLAAICTKQMY